MAKLKLVNIVKKYVTGDTVTEALKGVSLSFRENEFVSILGQSGCGKTTMLNIIGGLDKYTSGDLIINGMSTKDFKDSDWDAYRNRSIGFVFQSYNLISHQTVLQNVEISMTLSGVSPKERTRRAKEALEAVQLTSQINKKPNQLSGGQMQRVAIARALVNNPDIILADEPTGALDSHTSIQIMDILKEIAKDRLVIMVTHNAEMAEQYSNRVIRVLDGEVVSDSNPVVEEKESKKAIVQKDKKALKKTSMSMKTAIGLSFRNLLTKKGRTIITSFAGSIGIIGVALVLALSNGLSQQISDLQTDALSGFPITIGSGPQQTVDEMMLMGTAGNKEYEQYPDSDEIIRYDSSKSTKAHTNIFSKEYLDFINDLNKNNSANINAVTYEYGIEYNVLSKAGDSVVNYQTTSSTQKGPYGTELYVPPFWSEMPDNSEYVLSQYDLIGEGSRLPKNKNEVALVVDSYNRLDEQFFKKLGITKQDKINMKDFIGKKYLKVILNNDYYSKTASGNFVAPTTEQYDKLYNSENGVELVITGILRLKKGSPAGYIESGIVYTKDLSDYVLENSKKSEIAIAQSASDKDVITGQKFEGEQEKSEILMQLGYDTTPVGIMIYPKDFDSKEKIKDLLNDYNNSKDEEAKVVYNDMAETVTDMIGDFLNVITYVLAGFAAVSLIVSSIMIGIITYVSVIERTKEIGILRSVGARKKDISRVFNAETLIIGFTAGVIGVLFAWLLTFPINAIINKLVEVNNIANLSATAALLLVAGSMVLTIIAGFVPSKIAAKKDPVVALRTE